MQPLQSVSTRLHQMNQQLRHKNHEVKLQDINNEIKQIIISKLGNQNVEKLSTELTTLLENVEKFPPSKEKTNLQGAIQQLCIDLLAVPTTPRGSPIREVNVVEDVEGLLEKSRDLKEVYKNYDSIEKALKSPKFMESVAVAAAALGSDGLVKWALNKLREVNPNIAKELGPKICAKAAILGNVGIVRWARENGCPWDKETCAEAAYNGRLEFLKWARKHKCPWDSDTCIAAAQGGHIDVLEWATKNGATYNASKLDIAAKDHLTRRWIEDNLSEKK